MIHQHLQRSAATAAFVAAVDEFLRSGSPNERVHVVRSAPGVKVERTLTKILEMYPELPIERVVIDGSSGCEFFRGTATIETPNEERQVAFVWDCRWRAEEQGWTDWFGFPDQTRAAREFGYDCFRVWEEERVVCAS